MFFQNAQVETCGSVQIKTTNLKKKKKKNNINNTLVTPIVMLTRNYSLGFELLGKLRFSCCMSRIFKSNLEFLGLVTVKISVTVNRRGIWREHSSKKWIRPRFSVDLIKGLQISRAKPKLTQIFHLSSGVPVTFFLGTIFVGIVGRRP
jgi:hypothetical protein